MQFVFAVNKGKLSKTQVLFIFTDYAKINFILKCIFCIGKDSKESMMCLFFTASSVCVHGKFLQWKSLVVLDT